MWAKFVPRILSKKRSKLVVNVNRHRDRMKTQYSSGYRRSNLVLFSTTQKWNNKLLSIKRGLDEEVQGENHDFELLCSSSRHSQRVYLLGKSWMPNFAREYTVGYEKKSPATSKFCGSFTTAMCRTISPCFCGSGWLSLAFSRCHTHSFGLFLLPFSRSNKNLTAIGDVETPRKKRTLHSIPYCSWNFFNEYTAGAD